MLGGVLKTGTAVKQMNTFDFTKSKEKENFKLEKWYIFYVRISVCLVKKTD